MVSNIERRLVNDVVNVSQSICAKYWIANILLLQAMCFVIMQWPGLIYSLGALATQTVHVMGGLR